MGTNSMKGQHGEAAAGQKRHAVTAGILVAVMALALAIAGCSNSSLSSPTSTAIGQAKPVASGYANPDLLVETDWLAQKLSDSSIRVVDVRPPNDYKAGHIKGAVNIPVASVFLSASDAGTIGSPQQITELFSSKGIGNDNRVIVYDAGKEFNAARVLWTLEYYGHKKASVLNGGFKKWQKENREASIADPTVTSVQFVAKADPAKLATLDDMRAAVGKPGVAIIDARSPQEYSGDDLHAKRGGHFPGAVNIDWVVLFTDDGTLKPAAELAKIYLDKGVDKDKEVYVHCQVGMRSAEEYLALRLLGYDKVRHYVASWQEWGNLTDTPIEK